MFGTGPYPGTYQNLRDTVYAPSLIDGHPRSWEPSECAGRPVACDDPRVLEKGLRMGGDVERDLRDRQGTGVPGTGCSPARAGRRQPDPGRILRGSAGGGRADAVDRLRHRTDAPEDMSPSSSSYPFTLDLAHAFDGHIDDPRDIWRGPGASIRRRILGRRTPAGLRKPGHRIRGVRGVRPDDGARDLPVHACVPARAGGRDGGGGRMHPAHADHLPPEPHIPPDRVPTRPAADMAAAAATAGRVRPACRPPVLQPGSRRRRARRQVR